MMILIGGVSTVPAFGQSQAINGTIEGTVKDAQGGVLPGVTVTVTNLDTGAVRVVVTNVDGLFRAPLLPLGRYRVAFEMSNFSKHERGPLNLTAGAIIVLNETMTVGVQEAVTVTAETPTVDLAKTSEGRNLNEVEIKNLPNVSRNPYNFALLQPGVTGSENSEFGVPRFGVNGQPLRVNYQVDGNTNTQKDRAGLRLMPMSEVMIREVQVVTSGFAPEFGQTTGLVYNAVTPSGTNRFVGDVGYRFRTKDFSTYPFFFTQPKTDANKPDNSLSIMTGTIGGPVVKDKLHFYYGLERTYRDMERVITIDPTIAQTVGVEPQPATVPAYQEVFFNIGKLDWQVNTANRLTFRMQTFSNDNPYNAGGGGNTALERSVDFKDRMFSTAIQFVSSLNTSSLNELRIQFAQRHQERFAPPGAPTGVAVNINGGTVNGVNNNINFGAPTGDGEDFVQQIFQVLDNYTYLRGNHSYKFGFDLQFIDDHRAVPLPATYTFPTVAAYQSAAAGVTPKSYTQFAQTVAILPTFDMNNSLLGLFVQDDWKISQNFKLLYGVRYDYYMYPAGIPNSPYSQSFARDANNWAPRAGFAWTLDEAGRSVLRASTSVMYDQPLLAIIEQSYENSGDPRRVSVTLAPTAANAPSFPNVLTTASGTQSTIFSMDPEFRNGRTFQNNITYERQLGRIYSWSIGGMYARGYGMPVISDVNYQNPTSTLADGRPVFSTAVNATTRVDPRYNRVRLVQSIGDSWYKALTLTFGRRWANNVQFDLNYTLAEGIDTAPLGGNTLSVQGDAARSDPTNLARDKGPNSLDIRHTFNGSIVAMSTVTRYSPTWNAILSDHQISAILTFNSGTPTALAGNRDLNLDGINNDRPLDIPRNNIYLPARSNVDLRYSRFFALGGTRRFEVQAEFKNIFNIEQVSNITTTVTVNTAGQIVDSTGAVVTTPPSTNGNDYPATSGYEQRKFQLGFKFFF
jgi:hypothetical protein